jgi:aryl-alcohol dehydrogenase-like predicted oxidoreductase
MRPGEFTSLGWANEVIRAALSPYPVVAAKVGPGAAGMVRPEELRGQVEQNLRELGRDHLDVVYLRQAGLTSIADHFVVLADLRPVRCGSPTTTWQVLAEVGESGAAGIDRELLGALEPNGVQRPRLEPELLQDRGRHLAQ